MLRWPLDRHHLCARRLSGNTSSPKRTHARNVCVRSEVQRRLGSDLNPLVLIAIAPTGISEVEGRAASLVERPIDANIQQGDEREIESDTSIPDEAPDVAQKPARMGKYSGAYYFQKVESRATHDGARPRSSRRFESELGFRGESDHWRLESVPEAERHGRTYGVERFVLAQISHDDVCPDLRGNGNAVVTSGLIWDKRESKGRSIDEKHEAR